VTALNHEILPGTLERLSDHEFMHRFDANADADHVSNINTLHFLNELERRKLFLDLGYSSAFDYCVRKLKCCSSSAGRQIQAARCIRRYPECLEFLRGREVSVTTLALIENVLTDENKDSILERVRGASRREVERLLSEYRAPVPLRDRLRYVQVPPPPAKDIDVTFFERSTAHNSKSIVWQERLPSLQKVYVQFLAEQDFLELFEEVCGLVPDHDDLSFAATLKVVLAEYRDRHSPTARQRRREERKRENSPDSLQREWKNAQSDQTRHIPDETRDEVFVRDGGRCSFVAADGTRCQCRKGFKSITSNRSRQEERTARRI
jgi:hypothetical protein